MNKEYDTQNSFSGVFGRLLLYLFISILLFLQGRILPGEIFSAVILCSVFVQSINLLDLGIASTLHQQAISDKASRHDVNLSHSFISDWLHFNLRQLLFKFLFVAAVVVMMYKSALHRVLEDLRMEQAFFLLIIFLFALLTSVVQRGLVILRKIHISLFVQCFSILLHIILLVLLKPTAFTGALILMFVQSACTLGCSLWYLLKRPILSQRKRDVPKNQISLRIQFAQILWFLSVYFINLYAARFFIDPQDYLEFQLFQRISMITMTFLSTIGSNYQILLPDRFSTFVRKFLLPFSLYYFLMGALMILLIALFHDTFLSEQVTLVNSILWLFYGIAGLVSQYLSLTLILSGRINFLVLISILHNSILTALISLGKIQPIVVLLSCSVFFSLAGTAQIASRKKD